VFFNLIKRVIGMILYARFLLLSMMFGFCVGEKLVLGEKLINFKAIKSFSISGARVIKPLIVHPNFCAVLNKKGQISIWDWSKQKKVKTLAISESVSIGADYVGQLDELEDGRLVSLSGTVSCGFKARVWDIEKGVCVECLNTSFWPKPSFVIVKNSNGGDCIAFRSDYSSLIIWNLANKAISLKTHSCNKLEKVGPSGYIVTQCSNDFICLHNLMAACSHKCIDSNSCVIKHKINSSVSLDYQSMIKVSNKLVCISNMCDIAIFDVEKYSQSNFNIHNTALEGISALSIHGNETLLVSWDAGNIKIWDIKNSKNILCAASKNISDGIRGVAISGQMLFVLTKKSEIKVYAFSCKNVVDDTLIVEFDDLYIDKFNKKN